MGFIGGHLIRYVKDKYDFSIINLDESTYAGNLNNLVDVSKSKKYRFVKADICDRQNAEGYTLDSELGGPAGQGRLIVHIAPNCDSSCGCKHISLRSSGRWRCQN